MMKNRSGKRNYVCLGELKGKKVLLLKCTLLYYEIWNRSLKGKCILKAVGAAQRGTKDQ
jgi:hypothetical protein